MGISFNKIEGSAKKTVNEYIKFKDGKNKFRIVSDVLPRYVYWKKSYDGQANLAIECLSFSREEEKFTNVEKDWFSEFFPNDQCSWAYVAQAIDYSGDEPELKVLALRKKMFGQIQETASKEEFGDPTNWDTGWTCVVNRKKTGPKAFNVEYTLDQFDSIKTKGPLSDIERELLKDMKPIEELMPRQTPDEQKKFIERTILNPPATAEGEDDENTDKDALKEAEE